MTYVLTLIANPINPVLGQDVAARVAARLEAEGATLGTPVWLNPGVACDLAFSGIDPAHATLMADEALTGAAVDSAVQAAAGRRKKLLIADMDSTMIQVECIDELADFAGFKEKVARITEAAMRGELDFKQALRERVGLLKGMGQEILEQVYRERVTFMPGGRELIRSMNHNGALTVLVSGGFTFFTGRVSEVLGFQINRANNLEIEGGKLTGRVLDPIVDSETKLQSLKHFAAEAGIDLTETMAVGDGANDIPMIQAAGLGVAYHAKPKAAAAADVALRYADLTALLYLQGYSAAEFVTGQGLVSR